MRLLLLWILVYFQMTNIINIRYELSDYDNYKKFSKDTELQTNTISKLETINE